jgi:cob(I)alamin adenosyltransferase
MALFTGKGDKGTTKLFDTGRASKDGARHDSAESGARVTKSAPIFECLGQLDELNTVAGWTKVACPDDFVAQGKAGKELLREVQDHLFTIQAEVAGAHKSVPQSSVEALGALINAIEKELPEIKTFLVPGGTEFSARLDIARAISRRAERRLVALHESGDRIISEASRAYANRLSSLFYALARLANHRAGATEVKPRYRDV